MNEQHSPTASAEHPHGPEDPRWIDDDGRCVLCGRDYWQERALRAEGMAHLGLATTHQLLEELEARATVGGYGNYRTADNV